MGTQQVQEDKEPHGEATEPEQLWEQDKLAQVVNGRVDPTTTLREQNSPRLRSDRVCDGICVELGAEGREMLEHQSRELTIFTEGEQVLLVQRVNMAFRIVVDDTVRNDDRTALVSSTNPVKRETTGQTSNTAEQTLECLG